MIIDTHLHPTNLVDEAWRHTGMPFNGERMLKLMDGPDRKSTRLNSSHG